MNWPSIFLFETFFVIVVVLGTGLLKFPYLSKKRRLSREFPWGYYPDAILNAETFIIQGDNQDFLHNTITRFECMPGSGLSGEFIAAGFAEGYSNW